MNHKFIITNKSSSLIIFLIIGALIIIIDKNKMDFVQKKQVPADTRAELKQANEDFTECISKNFLPKFLKGDAIKVEEVCVNER